MKMILHLKAQETESEIVCGENIAERELQEIVRSYGQVFVFTDSNVERIYGEKIAEWMDGAPRYAMTAGEANKQPETLLALLKEMAAAGLCRNACLIAIGGGVAGDIGGLASALYMRGIDCVQVPTTLLAQVDSSVGGKTAVDLGSVKNLVGAFKQPNRVIADSAFFKTLPAREIVCGLGEIVKHGALDGDIFDMLQANRSRLKEYDFLAEIVPYNIAYKARVVEEDERESGLRKCLNLGHTTAHALELYDGKLSHGEYVLVGTVFEGEIARRHTACDGAFLDKLKELALFVLGGMPALPPMKEAARFAFLDKKNRSAGNVCMTVPVKKGGFAILELPYEQYERELLQIREELC